MDHFEYIAKLLLERDGFWTRTSFKVNLSKQQKRDTGKHTIPRPEIDIVAFKPSAREVLAVEVKSLFDSPGVNPEELTVHHDVAAGGYKLFTTPNYREIVTKQLTEDLLNLGLIDSPYPVRLGLIAGKVRNDAEDRLRRICADRGWFFWGPSDVKARVLAFADEGYENEAAVITAKILQR